MSYCSNCGSELENGAVFCEECGARVHHKEHTTEEVVQAVVDEFNRQYYADQLKSTLTFAIIAMVAVALILMTAGVNSGSHINLVDGLAVGLGFAGLPSGWSILNKIFGGFVFGGIIGIVFLIIHFFLALFIGWIALPVKVVYYIYKIKQATNA